MDGTLAREILAAIDGDLILRLTQEAIRIPSHNFDEARTAEYYAARLKELGAEVEIMPVIHPRDPAKRSQQPIGRVPGRGDGPSLMLNGHMDTIDVAEGWTVDPYGGTFRDGWVWGLGAQDDKGGLAAALAALAALRASRIELAGDLLICPVAAHKGGGAGTRNLLARGVRTDACINLEHSANTIATSCVGRVQAQLTTRSPDLFFRWRSKARAAYLNPIEQQALIMDRLGASLEPVRPGKWLAYTADVDLPDFPMYRLNSIVKAKTSRECVMTLEVRTVPGQTAESIRADLEALTADVRAEHPAFVCEVLVPADGLDDITYEPPMSIAKGHPLVLALAAGQGLASGREPVLGGGLRIGNVGDGNLTAAAGIPSLQYGPGDIRIYPEWPAPDERVELRQLIETSGALACAVAGFCGVA